MLEQFLQKTTELMAQGISFAVATVVRCVPPTSGKPGDKAIVLSDGKIWGWIGGGCAQPVVAKEALKALADGSPRLVRISPSPDGREEGIVDYSMTCHSGGALDIYIEPVLPKPHLVILGRSPIGQTLGRLALAIGYRVSVVVTESVGEAFADASVIASRDYSLDLAKPAASAFIVVSTQGEGDEEALEQALKTDARYVAFVASKTKAEKVFDYLKSRGITSEALKQVHSPAGLDLNAKSPEEVAVSILAEIIQARNQVEKPTAKANVMTGPALPVLNAGARDPVCGMSVNVDYARHKSEHGGTTYYFCCAGCKHDFDREPQRYLAAQSA